MNLHSLPLPRVSAVHDGDVAREFASIIKEVQAVSLSITIHGEVFVEEIMDCVIVFKTKR